MLAVRSHRVSLVVAISAFVVLATAPQLASAQTHSSPFGSTLLGAMIPPWAPSAPAPSVDPESQRWDPDYQMRNAQLHAAPGGGRVLRTAQAMIDQGTVVRGSCYDWIRTVFERASGRWSDAFRGQVRRGRFAQVQDFQPGDWVLFVNEAFGGDPRHTHSAIFIGWSDPAERVALMMSYPGGRRDEPGRYSSYVLTRAYRIVRMGDAETPTRTRARRRH